MWCVCSCLFQCGLKGNQAKWNRRVWLGHRPSRRARDSCDRVKIMVSRPLEGGRVGREPQVVHSSSIKQNRLKSTKIVFVSIHFDHTFHSIFTLTEVLTFPRMTWSWTILVIQKLLPQSIHSITMYHMEVKSQIFSAFIVLTILTSKCSA